MLPPRRIVALAVAALIIAGLGLLPAFVLRTSCAGPCPATVARGADHFWFHHRDLGPNGSITARLVSMTGTVTFPPRPGLVPWAKTGIIVKDGVRPGSSYAALMMTGGHGVRFQHDYVHDVAAGEGDWLRLTRAGDTITAAQSADGRQWHTVGTAILAGLAPTAQAGLFAASPGVLTVLPNGTEQVRFSQAVGAFDNVTVTGAGPGGWRGEAIGEMNQTDWEKYHHASGSVTAGGVVTVSGTGDIGPVGDDFGITVRWLLAGVPIALILLLVLASRPGWRPSVLVAATFGTGLIAIGGTVPAGLAVLRAHGNPVQPVASATLIRVIVGLAVLLALSALLAHGLARWTRRPWLGATVATALVVVPYLGTAVPLLPVAVADWLLRLTPAAAFAVQQTVAEYPQVTANYTPAAGYFPLPWPVGLGILAAGTAVTWIAPGLRSRRPGR